MLRVAVIQQRCWPAKQQSLAESERLMREAATQGAQLVLLQELHAGPYFCQVESSEYFELAEPLDGPTSNRLAALAKELNLVVVGSLFERRMAGVYHNTAVVFDRDGSLAGHYRKMHIPDDPGFYEKYYFTPGDAVIPGVNGRADQNGFMPVSTSLGKLGILVCWDQWYPEAARIMALNGADLLLYPTAIGWDPADTQAEQIRQRNAWETVQRGHAIANHLPVLVANRVGHEADPSGQSEGIEFWGNSFIAGPQGEFLAQSQILEAEVLLADFDLQRTEKLRRIWPYFRDRRIDAYAPLLRRVND